MRSHKFVLGLLFIFLMVLLPSISALEFDNCKEYNADTKVVKIKNMCPLGIDWFAEEMANIQLTTPLNVLVASGDDVLVAETKVCGKAEFKDMMKGFETYDVKNNMAKKEKNITIREKVVSYEQVPKYSEVCESVQDLIQNSTNGTISYHQECVKTQTGTENKEIVSWKDISQKDIKEGCYDIGLFTDVQAGDYIEWIPNYFGVRVEEWASFQQSTAVGLVSYYRLDETSGTTLMDDMMYAHGVYSTTGLTLNRTGKIGNAPFWLMIAGQTAKISKQLLSNASATDYSFSAWYNLTNSTQTNPYVIDMRKESSGTPLRDMSFNTGTTWFESICAFRNDANNYATAKYNISSNAYNNWHYTVCSKTGTNLSIYVDGIYRASTTVVDSATSTDHIDMVTGDGAGRLTGQYDEVGVWNRSLTASEVTELYNSGTGLNNLRTDYYWNSYNLSTNLISYYKLDETSGAIIDSLNRNNGTNNGADTYQIGKLNTAYNFVKADPNNIQIVDSASLDFTDYLTISMWIKPDAWIGNSQGLLAKGLATTQGKYQLQVNNFGGPTDELKFILNNGDATCSAGTGSLKVGEWNFITATYNKSASEMKVYINGVLKGTTSYSTSIATDTTDLYLGTYYLTSEAYDGIMDEVGLWNTSLSATQVQALYNYSSALIYASSSIPPFVTTSVSPAHGYSTNIASVIHTCNATTTATLTNISLVVDGTIVATNTSVSGNSSQVTFNYTYADGSYDWNCIAFDNTSANASSTTRAITIETTEPVITGNITNGTLYVLGGNMTLNYNVTHLPDLGGVTAWYSYNGTNRSLDTSQSSINFTTALGQYDLVLYANDTFGNNAVPVSLNFTLDTVYPQITLNYPTSLINYGAINGTLQLNFSASDTNLDDVWYNYNGTNVSISGALSGIANLSNITLRDKNTYVGFSRWCYQESPNVSNQTGIDGSCGLNYSGSYASVGIISFIDRITDGNWNTFGGGGTYLVNYSKPTGALTAILAFKGSSGVENFTLTEQCFNAYSDKISIKVAFESGWSNVYCWNGTTYNEIGDQFDSFVYEEAIYWGIGTAGNEVVIFANDTAGNLNATTFSWDYKVFENSRTYTTSVSELAQETFILNTTFYTGYTPSFANLVYNGTNYPSTITSSNGNKIFTNSFEIPLGTGPNIFYWNITYTDGITSFNQITTSSSQTISQIILVACNGTYTQTALNFTIKEEGTFTILNGSLEASLSYWTEGSSGIQYKTFSYSNTSQNFSNFQFCIYPTNLYLKASGIVSYAKTGYDAREYYFDNASVNNITQNIPLYLLSTATSDVFTFTIIDESDNEIEDAYIYIQRWDIGTSNYYTIAILNTDSSGKASINLRLNDAWYRYVVVYNEQTYLTTEPVKETTTSRTLRIYLREQNPYQYFLDVSHALTFNNATNTFTFTYTDTTGATALGCLRVYNESSINNELIADSCLNSVSGSIAYPVIGNGTFTAQGIITLISNYSSVTSVVDTLMVNIGIPTRFIVIGKFGQAISMIAIGTMALIGIAAGSIPLGLFLIVATFIGLSWMGLINTSTSIYSVIALILMLILTGLRRRGGS